MREKNQDRTPTILFGGTEVKLTHVNLEIKTDGKDNFVSVKKNGRWISVDDWNRPHLTRDPNKN